MKVALTVLALGMLSCGQQDLANVGNVGDEVNKFGYKVSTTDDIIGKNANDARSHMSDRGFSSEEIGHEVSTADDIAGEQANHARKHMSDRGASGEQMGDKAVEAKKHIGKKYHEGKDHTGKKANESREYTYTRGVQEMRHGDQDTQDAIQANKTLEELEESNAWTDVEDSESVEKALQEGTKALREESPCYCDAKQLTSFGHEKTCAWHKEEV